jgi:hypothetical protein
MTTAAAEKKNSNVLFKILFRNLPNVKGPGKCEDDGGKKHFCLCQEQNFGPYVTKCNITVASA